MKSESRKASQTSSVSESRKVRKPLMEKKRRARINDSLETLKQILLESRTVLKEPSNSAEKQEVGALRTAKLEKADILEMTVKYIQNMRHRIDFEKKNKKVVSKEADSSCESRVKVTLVSTRLENGDIAYVIPIHQKQERIIQKSENKSFENDSVWRPW